jgi:hypothetical protein
VLDRMASALDDAYELSPHGGTMPLVMAKHYANVMGTGGNTGPFNLPMLGCWFVSGPYAGLSILSGVLSGMDFPTAYENLQELAELRWHSRDLMVGVSPFADEMHHGPFQETYGRLAAVIEESRGI